MSCVYKRISFIHIPYLDHNVYQMLSTIQTTTTIPITTSTTTKTTTTTTTTQISNTYFFISVINNI